MTAPLLDFPSLEPLRRELGRHPVYAALRSVEDLRRFMSHHIYSVWDFMSVVKYLQGKVAPVDVPWAPVGDAAVRRFINEIVLEEESDSGLPGEEPAYLSHFELYCRAMGEVGADPAPAVAFVARAQAGGIAAALADGGVPAPARRFMETTFSFIAGDKPHVVAAALAWGREHVIPEMFRAFLRQMGIGESQAPAFHYYLKRHVHLDEDFHAPLSLRMVASLCAGDRARLRDAEQAAREALTARIAFWDGVHAALDER